MNEDITPSLYLNLYYTAKYYKNLPMSLRFTVYVIKYTLQMLTHF